MHKLGLSILNLLFYLLLNFKPKFFPHHHHLIKCLLLWFVCVLSTGSRQSLQTHMVLFLSHSPFNLLSNKKIADHHFNWTAWLRPLHKHSDILWWFFFLSQSCLRGVMLSNLLTNNSALSVHQTWMWSLFWDWSILFQVCLKLMLTCTCFGWPSTRV